MKRFVCTVLSCIMLIHVFNMVCMTKSDEVVISVDTVYVEESDSSAVVGVFIDENCGVAAGDITIESELEIVNIESDKLEIYKNVKNGKVNWSGVKNSYYNGEILKITFILPENFKNGDSWTVGIYIEDLINENLEQVKCTIKDGKIICGEENNEQSWIVIFIEKVKVFFKEIIEFIKTIFTLEGVSN